MIELLDVYRSYGSKVAVSGLNLNVYPGELLAYLGPNGAGKTTTIKMLVGLLRPTAGTIRICGYDIVTQTRQAHQLVGYVPDEPYLYDKLTGREFLWFVGEVHALDRGKIASRVAELTERFELSNFLDELAESYSHGMKQRVAFAAALLHDPAVLIVDEPMVGLDPRSARLVRILLGEMAAAGKSVLMSTHSLGVAEQIASRIGIIDGGRLRFTGTLDQLRQTAPQDTLNLEELFLRFIANRDLPVSNTADPTPPA
ncbi:MAG: ABC transporter ATP-binding protein [Pirellulales bacterium]|nr:ABC transporter ATP-binding protein [Pirellulales bacterium]